LNIFWHNLSVYNNVITSTITIESDNNHNYSNEIIAYLFIIHNRFDKSSFVSIRTPFLLNRPMRDGFSSFIALSIFFSFYCPLKFHFPDIIFQSRKLCQLFVTNNSGFKLDWNTAKKLPSFLSSSD
jgi:hypothetical protein